MAWRNHLHYWGALLLVLLLSIGRPVPTLAQAPATGDGLNADYYSGVNFDQLVLSRRDARIAFEWAQQPPGPGLPAQYFSVRWTGWLRPPAGGRYLFHITVDDGMRIWLNDRLILNEWQSLPARTFTVAVNLRAREAYRLRVEYYQDILDTRAQLTWERPDVPLAPPPPSWRNLWGMAAATPVPEPIPTRYLFSRDPGPRPARPTIPPPAPPKLSPPVLPEPTIVKAAPPTRPRRRPNGPAPALLAPVTAAVRPIMPASPPLALADSGSTARLVNLAVGETVTLPELYFAQGQARLLPAACTALDGLAAALRTRPSLRLEVQGHTDNVGNAELNRQLSQQRAEAVCLYLTAHGVTTAQLHATGYGGTQPVADNADPAQRPRNRRVVLRRL